MSRLTKVEAHDAVAQAFKNDAFDNGFEQYFKDRSNNKISTVLNDSERKIKLQTVTYRQLNSWEEHGLLTIKRKDRGWRRFSIMEALWLKLISELREFGLPLEKIKTTKESLSTGSKKYGVAMPMLEFFTAFAIGNKMPVMLLVFTDGVAIPVSYTQYKAAKEVAGLDNHIQIGLNELLQSFFPQVDLKPKYKGELPFSVNEMELLAYLRIGDFEKITVKFNNGQMEKFEGVQRLKAKKRIEEIIREHRYQDIQLQEEDGEITAVFQTIKKRFTKGSNPK